MDSVREVIATARGSENLYEFKGHDRLNVRVRGCQVSACARLPVLRVCREFQHVPLGLGSLCFRVY